MQRKEDIWVSRGKEQRCYSGGIINMQREEFEKNK